jgi:hypothetical protein
MEARDERRIRERRGAEHRSGEGRRNNEGRRIWTRRHGVRGGMTDGGKFDRRGAHPSLFATLAFPVSREPRRMDSVRRSGVMRRSFVRRCADRRAS